MAVSFRDYYNILGIPRNATPAEVQKAFRRLAREFHPDVNMSPEAEEKFKEINEANEVLKDPEKRQKYDELNQQRKPKNPFKSSFGQNDFSQFQKKTNGNGKTNGAQSGRFSDSFESVFGQSSRFSRKTNGSAKTKLFARSKNENDLEADMEVALEDLYHGRTIQFEIYVTQTGRLGREKVKKKLYDVKLPPGARDGSCIRLRGQGGKRKIGKLEGDLYISLKLAAHPHLKVKGYDVESDIPVAPYEAALGAWIQVPTLDGPMTIRLPAGTSSGKRLRLIGKGLPQKNGVRADQYVNFIIVVPPALTEAERRLYQSLSRLSKHNPRESF